MREAYRDGGGEKNQCIPTQRDDTPYATLACQMTTFEGEQRTRHLAILHRVEEAIQTVVELPDGYSLWFEADQYLLVTEFVAGERRCCSFIHFLVDIAPHYRPLWLRLTGGTGVKEAIKKELLALISQENA
jgi:hypothetical protein